MLQIQLKFYHYSGSSNSESQFQVLSFQFQVQVHEKPDSSPNPGLENYNSAFTFTVNKIAARAIQFHIAQRCTRTSLHKIYAQALLRGLLHVIRLLTLHCHCVFFFCFFLFHYYFCCTVFYYHRPMWWIKMLNREHCGLEFRRIHIPRLRWTAVAV